jgi:hypothetical protein
MRRLPLPIAPAVPGDSSIQPVDAGADFAVEAERVERLLADRALVDRLMWERYDGPTWDAFRRALAEYGLAVLYAWIRSGRIFLECSRKGFGGIQRRKRRCDDDDALGLAGETVTVSLVFFRDEVLIPGRWDATKGATLRTFFIGACVRHFPNVYTRSDGEEVIRALLQDETTLETITDLSQFSRPDRRVELVNGISAVKDPTIREVLLDEAQGYPIRTSHLRSQASRRFV